MGRAERDAPGSVETPAEPFSEKQNKTRSHVQGLQEKMEQKAMER